MAEARDYKVLRGVVALYNLLKKHGQLELEFVKKSNKETRLMNCTLDFKKILKSDHPKGKFNEQEMLIRAKKLRLLTVYDLGVMGWRSVLLDTINYVKTPEGEIYRLQK